MVTKREAVINEKLLYVVCQMQIRLNISLYFPVEKGIR